MTKERDKKPLRERVAERKEQEQKVKRGAKPDEGVETEEDSAASAIERRKQADLWWGRVALFGTALQALGIILVMIEIFIVWSTSGGWDRWQWLIVYCIVFGAGRVLKMVGDAQQSLRRR